MKKLNKLIFTKLRGRTAAVLFSGKRAVQMELEPEAAQGQTGNIYIGKVKNIVKNINAAFVEYQPGINGYYSLSDNRVHLFADRRVHETLKSGDEILVQVERAAVKTKDAVLTSRLSFTGQYTVLTAGDGKLGISSKIHDTGWKNQVRTWWQERENRGFGLIVRTNALAAGIPGLQREADFLAEKYSEILKNAETRNCCSLLYRPDSFPVKIARDTYTSELEEMITDDADIWKELTEAGFSPRLYQDEQLSLAALYSLESVLDEALSRKVWLKSGGNLVIEPTEAMTVIDVNTGKTSGKHSFSQTILSTNLEAAEEIARQMRLRNLSGIILIDFIDMDTEEDRRHLIRKLRGCLAEDPVTAAFVDMTALGLVEVTRKKIRQPLHEQILSLNLKK